MKELKNAGKKIKMPEDMKERIKNKCFLEESSNATNKESHHLDGRVIAALAACIILVFVIGMKNGVRNKEIIPVAQTTVSFMERTVAVPTEKLMNILTTVLTTVTQTEITACVETTGIAKTTKRNIETTQGVNNEITDVVEEGVPPPMFEMTIDKLKKLKFAAETMTDEEYSEYLCQDEFFDVDYARLYGKKEFFEFYAKVENLYIPVFGEEDIKSISSVCYTEIEDIDYIVWLKNSLAYRFDIRFSGKMYLNFGKSEFYEFVKKIETPMATAYVYHHLVEDDRSAWKGFCVDMNVCGQEMNFWVSEKQTIEEFEETFRKIEFKKIGDLVNEK